MVVIKFQKGEAPLVFYDAIVLTEEEAAGLSDREIEGMKDERYRQWLDIVTAPPESGEGMERVEGEGPIDG